MLIIVADETNKKRGGRSRPFALPAAPERHGPYNVKPNVTLMKTPICSRVTGCVGQ